MAKLSGASGGWFRFWIAVSSVAKLSSTSGGQFGFWTAARRRWRLVDHANACSTSGVVLGLAAAAILAAVLALAAIHSNAWGVALGWRRHRGVGLCRRTGRRFRSCRG